MTPKEAAMNAVPAPHAPRGLERLNAGSTHTAALVYAGRGWPVFPLAGIVSGHCGCMLGTGCAHPGKHPLLRGGLHGATTDPQMIDRWWRRWPWATLGLLTGPRSGLVVVDIDPRHGGQASLDVLRAQGLVLPPTLTVQTGGGGEHLFYHHPGRHVRNSAGTLPGAGSLPGLDLRGDGGYIVAPPSSHASGGRYQWAPDTASMARLPDWVCHQQPKGVSHRSVTAAAGHGERYAQAALDGEASAVRNAPEGTRNATLNRAAFKLGTLVGAGVLDQDAVWNALLRAGQDVGLDAREVAASVRSGLTSGVANPRRVSPTSSAHAQAVRHQQLQVGPQRALPPPTPGGP